MSVDSEIFAIFQHKVLRVPHFAQVTEVRHIYVSLQLSVQNAVSAQPCVGKLGISLVLLNFFWVVILD